MIPWFEIWKELECWENKYFWVSLSLIPFECLSMIEYVVGVRDAFKYCRRPLFIVRSWGIRGTNGYALIWSWVVCQYIFRLWFRLISDIRPTVITIRQNKICSVLVQYRSFCQNEDLFVRPCVRPSVANGYKFLECSFGMLEIYNDDL